MRIHILTFALAAAALQAGAITATKEYVDRKDAEIVSNTYTKAETDARITELSPPTSLEPATNYTDFAIGEFARTGTVANAGNADTAVYAEGAEYATKAWSVKDGETEETRTAGAIFSQLDAATATNAAQQTAIDGMSGVIQDALGSFAATGTVSNAVRADTAVHADDAGYTEHAWGLTNGETEETRTAGAIFAALDSIPGPGLTTNDVCAIVTNETEVLSEWRARGIPAGHDWYMRWLSEEEVWNIVIDGVEYSNDIASAYDSTNQVYDVFTEFTDTVVAYRVYVGKNALGLARLIDIPSTNGFVKASITNGFARLSDIPDIPTWGETNVAGVISYFNGFEHVTVPAGGSLSANVTGWPNGAGVFVDLVPAGVYTVSGIRLLGYGAWPTNRAEMVVWRSGENVIANVVLTY